jgi:murein DD-endopeptidase MepM/ murein hydrolase activator NlpD
MRNFGLGAHLSGFPFKTVIIGLAAVLLAGCSDSIERFSTNYSNPSDSDPVYTASIPKKKLSGAARYQAPSYQAPQADVAQVDEQPIVQNPVARAPVGAAPSYDYSQSYSKTYRQPNLAQAPAASASAPPRFRTPAEVAVAAPQAPTYAKPAYKAPVLADEQVADANPASVPVVAPVGRASGSNITVGQGMTLYAIAKANHMSVKQLAEANHIALPYSVAPGRVLKVPGVKKAVLPQVAAAPIAPAPQVADATPAVPAIAAGQHIVAKGDTLFSLGRKYNVSASAIADANGLAHDKALKLGSNLKIPAKGQVAAVKTVAPVPVAEDAGKTDADTTLADAKPAPLALPKTQQQVATATTPAAPAATPSDAQLAMRWPLRGKVISSFGAKPNGMKNEGINIAVPEGTKIQAAEAGVVAYAGNELKGYGNLILIRHAGGYVTAYAHASQLLVKKGDSVKRGDVIAMSGATGAVQSPQLHFEVRKGATALDPSTFLNSSTAAN